MPNNLDPDQARRFVGPDLSLNYLEILHVLVVIIIFLNNSFMITIQSAKQFGSRSGQA